MRQWEQNTKESLGGWQWKISLIFRFKRQIVHGQTPEENVFERILTLSRLNVVHDKENIVEVSLKIWSH